MVGSTHKPTEPCVLTVNINIYAGFANKRVQAKIEKETKSEEKYRKNVSGSLITGRYSFRSVAGFLT